MNTPQKNSKSSLYLSYSVLGLIFVVDCFVEFGIFGGIPYVIGLIVLMWLLKPSDVLWFSATCGALTVLAFLIGEDHTVLSGLMNRFMAIFTNVAIAMLVKRHTEVEESHFEQQRHLNSVVEKRTEGLKQVVDQLDEIKIRLSESEELGHFGFWEYYPATQQMIWSNGVFAIYGFPLTPQAPSMQEFLDQCHTEDIQTLQRSIQYGLTEKKPYTVEYRVIMPDGSVKWIFNKGRPIVNKQGNIETLVGTIQDVTTIKHGEESIQANRARYTTLFKSAGVGKALMIPNKRILEVNHAFAKWIGYNEQSLLKIPIEKLIHKDDRSMDDAYAREMVSGDIQFYQKEKRFVRRDGTILWGLYSVSPVHDALDKITCFAVEVVDITGFKNMQMALQKAQDSWHEAEEALTESEASRRLIENALIESEAARKLAEEKLQAGFNSPYKDQAHNNQFEEFLPEYEGDVSPLVSTGSGDELPPNKYEEEEPAFALLHNPFESSEAGPVDEQPGQRLTTSPTDDKPLSEPKPASIPDPAYSMTDEVVNNLFKNSRDLMAIIGLDGCYKRASPALTSELGFEKGELDNQHFLNFIHLDDREEVQGYFYDLRKGSNISKLTLRHMSKFDGFRRFLWNASVDEKQGVVFSVLKPAIDLGDFELKPDREDRPIRMEKPVAPVEPVNNGVPPPQKMPESETRPEQHAAPVNESRATPFRASQPARTADPVPSLHPTAKIDAIPEPSRIPEPASIPASKSIAEPANIPEPVVPATPVRKVADAAPDESPRRTVETPAPADKTTEPVDPAPRPGRQIDWHRLTDRMPFQVWMLGTDQSCRYVNKKVRDFTGLPFEQLEGKGWAKAVHPEDYRQYVEYYKSAFDDWKPMGCVYRLRRNDGAYRWVQESSVPLQKADGAYEGYLVTCMEISSLKSIDSKFVNAFDDAINLVDLKSALRPCQREESQHIFIDSVKIADALIANSREVPNAALASLIAFAGKRLLKLINKILSFAHADKNAHELLKRSVSLESVLENTVEMLAPLRRGEGPRFQINYNDDDVRVMVDKVLTHRVFENVLRNLIEWAESRVITLDISQREGAGIVEIKHIGPVLKANFLHQMDNMFRAGTSTQLQKKAGLELSLIKRLAEVMDGEMEVREDKESGPMIELRFDLAEPADTDDTVLIVEDALRGETPIEPAQVRQLAEVVEAIASLEAPPPNYAVDEPYYQATDEDILIHDHGINGKAIARHRVLVGETNSETQRLVRSLLQPYYDLTIVPNTDDLLKRAEESQFDLLLLDVHLQGGHSGVDVLRELRRRPQYTRTPAIAVASSTSPIDQRELIDRGGFDGFLRKPYSIVELLETVERMIES